MSSTDADPQFSPRGGRDQMEHAQQQPIVGAWGEGTPISDEPLINAVHRWLIEIVFVTFAFLLVYVSFVPFDFGRSPHGSTPFLGLATKWFHLKDVLANIGLYLPFGALAFAVGRRRGLGTILSAIIATIAAGVLSYLIERGQFFVVSRVSSWPDVVSNVLGAALGVALVVVCEGQIRRSVRRAREAVRANWWSALATVFVCVLLLAHLRPYDGVVDMFHTAAQMRYADMSPMARWNGLQAEVASQVDEGRRRSMVEFPRVQGEYLVDRGVDIVSYAALMVLIALGLRNQYRSRTGLYIWCGFVGISLAAIVTVIRIFLISHGFDSAHFFCALIAWPIACAIAHVLLGGMSLRQGQASFGPDELSTRWYFATLTVVVVAVLLYELVPFDFGTGVAFNATYDKDYCLVPFLWHFRSLPNDAVYDISGEILRYGAIATCLAAVLHRRSRRSWRQQLWMTVGATAVLAAALEGLHLFMASRHTDITTVLLAMMGAFAGATVLRWLRDLRQHLSVGVAEDMLTAQLIEGETFQPLPTPVANKNHAKNRGQSSHPER